MTDLVFFYGTLMSQFRRPGRMGIDRLLKPLGRGSISAALFDLGIYPAAVPAADSRVWGEVHQMLDPATVLRQLDDIEGYSAEEPEASLYIRKETLVVCEARPDAMAWAYFYNAPLGGAQRIVSGDYLQQFQRPQ